MQKIRDGRTFQISPLAAGQRTGCPRCSGFLLYEPMMGEGESYAVPALRCWACGGRFSKTILAHQAMPPRPRGRGQRGPHGTNRRSDARAV